MNSSLVDLELARSILGEKPAEKPERQTLILHADRILQFEAIIQAVRERILFVANFVAQCDTNIQALDGAKTEFPARVKDAPAETLEWLEQLLPIPDCKPEIFGLHQTEILTTMNAYRAKIAELRAYLMSFFAKKKLQMEKNDLMDVISDTAKSIRYIDIDILKGTNGMHWFRTEDYQIQKQIRDTAAVRLREAKEKLHAVEEGLKNTKVYQESDQADVEKAFDEITACRRQIRECALSCLEKFNLELETYKQVLDKLIAIIRSV